MNLGVEKPLGTRLNIYIGSSKRIWAFSEGRRENTFVQFLNIFHPPMAGGLVLLFSYLKGAKSKKRKLTQCLVAGEKYLKLT